MSGIKVLHLPKSIDDKDLQIYFSKPENGGGKIEQVYYPLPDQSAVILFENNYVAEKVMEKIHELKSTELMIKLLPSTQMYTKITAELDSSIASYLKATPGVLDEIRYIRGLKYHYDTRDKVASLCGNWYQLEWAWHHVDTIMQGQVMAQRSLTRQTDNIGAASRMDIEKLKISSMREPNENGEESPLISMPSTQQDGKRLDMTMRDDSRRPDISESDEEDTPVEPEEREPDKRPMYRADRSPQRASGSDDEGREESRDVDRTTAHSESSEDEDIDQPGAKSKMHAKGAKKTEIIKDNPDDPRSLDFKHGPLTVSIYTGNITMTETDVIVNAANGDLIHAGGVAAALESKAGKEMKEECRHYIKAHGSLKDSDVMHTSAGGRISPKVKHIIHAVGPMVSEVYRERSIHTLTKTFLNCMTYANKHLKVKSMTIPLISSGLYGGSVESCVEAFLDAVLLYVSEHTSEECNLHEVHLINNNTNHTVLTVTQIREYINQGLEPLTDTAVQKFEKMAKNDDLTLRIRSGRSGGYSALSTSSIPSGTDVDRRDFSRSLVSGASGYTVTDRTRSQRPTSELLTDTTSRLSSSTYRTPNFSRSFSSPSSSQNIPENIRRKCDENYGHMTSTGQSGARSAMLSTTENDKKKESLQTSHMKGRPLPEIPFK